MNPRHSYLVAEEAYFIWTTATKFGYETAGKNYHDQLTRVYIKKQGFVHCFHYFKVKHSF